MQRYYLKCDEHETVPQISETVPPRASENPKIEAYSVQIKSVNLNGTFVDSGTMTSDE